MKKFLYLIVSMAFLVSACDKDADIIDNSKSADINDENVVTTLSVSLPAATRITFDGENDFKSEWTEGDVIKVETTTGYQTYTLTDGAGTKFGTFTGRGTPATKGKAYYPAASWDDNGRFTFPASYIWNMEESNAKKLNSAVPMAGLIYGNKGQNAKVDFKYASGGIIASYSKMPLSTAKVVLKFTNKVTGQSTLSGEQLGIPNGTNEIVFWMNSNHTRLGGTAVDAQFFVPVPAGNGQDLEVSIYREDGLMVGGSHFKSKQFNVANKELKVFPMIHPDFPFYTFYRVEEVPVPAGEYILAYDRGNGKAWVNGDDNLRETVDADIVTLNHTTYPDWIQEDAEIEGIVLDMADYETSAWKVRVTGGNGNIGSTWRMETKNKGTFSGKFLGFTGSENYVNLYVNMEGGSTGNYNNIKYYSYQELLEINRDKYSSDPIYSNGLFLMRRNSWGNYYEVPSNMKLYRLLED